MKRICVNFLVSCLLGLIVVRNLDAAQIAGNTPHSVALAAVNTATTYQQFKEAFFKAKCLVEEQEILQKYAKASTLLCVVCLVRQKFIENREREVLYEIKNLLALLSTEMIDRAMDEAEEAILKGEQSASVETDAIAEPCELKRISLEFMDVVVARKEIAKNDEAPYPTMWSCGSCYERDLQMQYRQNELMARITKLIPQLPDSLVCAVRDEALGEWQLKAKSNKNSRVYFT